jgi:asparagine synthase (glutamine-hydrolysing)
MCGICGIFESDQACRIAPETIERMNGTLTHRGPDDAGYHFEPGLALGHRRLSIIDLSAGAQPMTNEDGTVWIVFNGEIYNFPELRTFLISKGHQFRTHSDTETIIHLYEELGAECFSSLRGMFAIALWDRRERRLVLARDRIGKKPLYYAWNGKRLVFGSELKAVLAAGDINRNLDLTAVADYFSQLCVPSPKSIYAGVRKVRPAHYVIASAKGIEEQEYWDLTFTGREEHTEKKWCDQIRGTLSEAVKGRLISDVPLGSFLSGGLDSSAVVATMSRLLDQPVKTCAVGFEEEDFNELPYAQEVAAYLHTDHRDVMVRPNAIEIVNRLAWHFDEPFADSSAIPTYYVSKAARENVTVALTGDGGDESFAGYRRYRDDADENRLRGFFPASMRRRVFEPLGRWYPTLERAPRILRGKSALQIIGGEPLEGYLRHVSAPATTVRSILSDDVSRQLGGYDARERLRDYYRRSDGPDHLSRIQYLDIKTYLTDDICTKVDRASMAVSLEVRSPLLDQQFMELAARIPSQLKLHRGTTKYIFKEAVREMLPKQTLTRRKQGFGVPIGEWFRSEVKEMAHATLFDCPDGILNETYLRSAWDRHQARVRDLSGFLWAAFMFRLWQKTFQTSLSGVGDRNGSLAGAGR